MRRCAAQEANLKYVVAHVKFDHFKRKIGYFYFLSRFSDCIIIDRKLNQRKEVSTEKIRRIYFYAIHMSVLTSPKIIFFPFPPSYLTVLK